MLEAFRHFICSPPHRAWLACHSALGSAPAPAPRPRRCPPAPPGARSPGRDPALPAPRREPSKMAAPPPLALNAPHRAHGAARDTRPPPAPPVVTAGRPSPAPFGTSRLRPILRSPAASQRTRQPAGPVPPSLRSPPPAFPSAGPRAPRAGPRPPRPAAAARRAVIAIRRRLSAGRGPPPGVGLPHRPRGRSFGPGRRRLSAGRCAPLGAGGGFVPWTFPLPQLPSPFAFDGRRGPAPPSPVPAAQARTPGPERAGSGQRRPAEEGARRRRRREKGANPEVHPPRRRPQGAPAHTTMRRRSASAQRNFSSGTGETRRPSPPRGRPPAPRQVRCRRESDTREGRER